MRIVSVGSYHVNVCAVKSEQLFCEVVADFLRKVATTHLLLRQHLYELIRHHFPTFKGRENSLRRKDSHIARLNYIDDQT